MVIKMYQIILLFFIYSFIGWVAEILFCLPSTKKITNRGFVYGPVCTIYGFGALFIIYALNTYFEYPFLIFVFGMLFATVLEYLTSVVMEGLFNVRWWDYSHYKYHIQGRVCLLNSLSFGLGALIIVYIIHPLVQSFISLFSNTQIMIASISFLVFFIIDYLLSIISALNFNKLYVKINQQEKTSGISNYVVNHFTNNYPNLKRKV